MRNRALESSPPHCNERKAYAAMKTQHSPKQTNKQTNKQAEDDTALLSCPELFSILWELTSDVAPQ